MRTDFETLAVERIEEYILVITMDRPEVANAKNTAMGMEFKQLFDSLYVDREDFRCVVLTGRGKVFCAGGDLKERKGMSDAQWKHQHAIFEQGVLAMRMCPIPIIAAVNGPAYGGGCEMALTADFAYASTTAKFALTEVTLGIMPGAMGTQNLPHAVGERRAKEIILTGSPFGAEESLQWGLVNRICQPDELMDEVIKTAARIASNAPQSIMRAKRSLAVATQIDRFNGYQFELEAYNRLVGLEDRREGILAFNEKRAPRYSGK